MLLFSPSSESILVNSVQQKILGFKDHRLHRVCSGHLHCIGACIAVIMASLADEWAASLIDAWSKKPGIGGFYQLLA